MTYWGERSHRRAEYTEEEDRGRDSTSVECLFSMPKRRRRRGFNVVDVLVLSNHPALGGGLTGCALGLGGGTSTMSTTSTR